MKKKIMSRWMAAVLAGTMVLTAGCGKKEEPAQPAKTEAPAKESKMEGGEEKSGTIRFAIYTDTARDLVAQAQAELYMEKNPGVKVEIVSVPFANYYTQLGQGLAAGSAWDVFMINGASFAELGKTGQLMDLTDEIASRE